MQLKLGVGEMRPFVVGGALLLLLAGETLFASSAGFGTVLNVPPDSLPQHPAFIGSNTQVNHFAGAQTPGFFDVGDPLGGSVNVEFNFHGGVVFDEFDVNGGAVLNMFGGATGAILGTAGSQLNIYSGDIDRLFVDGTAKIYGGNVRELRSASGAIELVGTSFAVDNAPIMGLLPGTAYEIDEREITLSGRLLDGTEFSYVIDSMQGGSGSLILPAAVIRVVLAPEPATASLGALGLGVLIPRRLRSPV